MSMHKGIIGQSEGGASVNDKTLGDYIQRKLRQDAFDSVANEKKLTFEEWFVKAMHWGSATYENYDLCKETWKAAQENK